MQSFNDIIFLHENIFKVDHLKQVYLTKFTDNARKTFAIRGQNRNTLYQTNLTQEKSIYKHTAWFSTPIFIPPGVEMKTTGNHIARFKNIYLRKLTKSKIHGAFTCLLTVCKSLSHGWLLP